MLHRVNPALPELRDQASSCCNDVRNKVIEKKLELEARIKAMKAMSRALDRSGAAT
jgi:hypothetical protein